MQLLIEAAGRNDLRIVAFEAAGTRALAWFPRLSAIVIEATSKRLVREGIGAVSMDFASPFFADFDRIATLLIEHRLPAIGATRQGFLLEYQASLLPLARKSAEYIDKILRGAEPAYLPVEQATALELRINLKTANAIGLRIPPSMQMRAAALIR